MTSGSLKLLGKWTLRSALILSGYALVGTLLALSTLAAPADTTKDNKAIVRLNQISFLTEAVPFVQTHISPLLRREITQRGSLSYTQDGALRMLYTEPRWEQRTLSGETLSLVREVANHRGRGSRRVSRSTVLDLNQPQHLALFALQAVLRQETRLLHAYFDAQLVAAEGDAWRVWLIPLDMTQRQVMPHLELSGQGTQLKRFRSERVNASGATTHFVQVDIQSARVATAAPVEH